jgi:hypothetical protein
VIRISVRLVKIKKNALNWWHMHVKNIAARDSVLKYKVAQVVNYINTEQ